MAFLRADVEWCFIILLSTWSFLRPDLEGLQHMEFLREIVMARYRHVVANNVWQ
jgi:hypothetical protein